MTWFFYDAANTQWDGGGCEYSARGVAFHVRTFSTKSMTELIIKDFRLEVIVAEVKWSRKTCNSFKHGLSLAIPPQPHHQPI